MGRLPRPLFPGATYHVFARGNRRSDLFLDDLDYHNFLSRLRRVSNECGMAVHAFCLMPNHFHLLVRTDEKSLAHVMQRLLGGYARRFNTKYELEGHVFQGRYRAELVGHDDYFRVLLRYIHRNPVKAGLVLRARDWAYSSYGLLARRNDEWLRLDEVWASVSSPEEFEHFVEDAGDDSPPNEGTTGFSVMASEQEIRRIALRMSEHYGASVSRWQPPMRWHPWRRPRPRDAIAVAAARWASACDAPLDSVVGPSRNRAIAMLRRELIRFLAVNGFLGREIAALLCRDPSFVSNVLARPKPTVSEGAAVANG